MMPFVEELPEAGQDGAAGADELPRYVIRRIQLAHCSRGPDRCARCRQMNVSKICLLDLAPPRPGEVQRRVIGIQHRGTHFWREFEVERCFESEEEASCYAQEHGIEDVQVS